MPRFAGTGAWSWAWWMGSTAALTGRRRRTAPIPFGYHLILAACSVSGRPQTTSLGSRIVRSSYLSEYAPWVPQHARTVGQAALRG